MEKNLKEKIQKWAAIQKGDLLMDLINLVNIPSVSDTDCKEVPFGRECQRALKWMLDRGTEFGFMGTDYDGYAGSLSLNGEEKTNPRGHRYLVSSGCGASRGRLVIRSL